ncbi:MAG: hypothetical protein PHS93_09065 [Candidatus Omnitrophica bacterium]|nr:hypothetical protein [Candidatus Omnitrophota bacterium]MDD5551287.1 hypothetical protein [Candidatus Omnitrophota bacterium]
MTLKEIQERNPNWSSYTCFVEYIRGRGLPKGKLRKLFFKEVERGDYLPSEQEETISFLMEINNIVDWQKT